MTPDELSKEAEQIHFALNHEPLMDYEGTVIFLESRLRAVHDAAMKEAGRFAGESAKEMYIEGFNDAIEKAAKIADDEECVCTDEVNCDGNYRIADKIRALKIGDAK